MSAPKTCEGGAKGHQKCSDGVTSDGGLRIPMAKFRNLKVVCLLPKSVVSYSNPLYASASNCIAYRAIYALKVGFEFVHLALLRQANNGRPE